MSKRPLIVMDTNLSINRKSIENFLGFREELNKFAANAKIILPKVVVDEIRNQKERFLCEARDSFLKNPYRYLLNILDDSVHLHNTSELIDKVLAEESIPYKIVDIADKKAAFEKIYSWAVKNLAPFAPDTDKGFKDACVAVIIEELLTKNEVIFLCTRDTRLAETFKLNPRVKIVRDYDEFKKYSINDFLDDYLIQKIGEELSIDPAAFNIEDSWQNHEDNWVFKFNNNGVQLVVVDSEAREILKVTDEDPVAVITSLESSGSFQNTHTYIEFLRGLYDFLSLKHFHKLLNIFLENDQIYLIATDADVKNFFFRIYERIKTSLDSNIAIKIEDYLGIKT